MDRFSKSSASKSGIRATCKDCSNKASRLWREKNPGKAEEASKSWEARNKERVKNTRKIYRANNREAINAAKRAYVKRYPEKKAADDRRYNEANKEKISLKHKEWRAQNKEALSIKAKSYYQKNKEKIAAYKSKYSQKNKHVIQSYRKRNRERINQAGKDWYHKVKDDPDFAASRTLRRVLNNFIRYLEGSKADRTHSVLGYNAQQLKQRLECQFRPGMSWENYGDWHIDHKIPVSHFLRRGEARPHVVNALSNLQPLWALENLTKNNRWVG